MISATNTVTSAAFAELKQQMALRVADQAEREAEQLKTQADEKRKEARDMAQTARELELESGQAQSRAELARASLPPTELLDRLQQQFSGIIRATEQEPEQDDAESAANLNLLGQRIGTTINIEV